MTDESRPVKKRNRTYKREIAVEGMQQSVMFCKFFGPETAAVDIHIIQDPVTKNSDKEYQESGNGVKTGPEVQDKGNPG